MYVKDLKKNDTVFYKNIKGITSEIQHWALKTNLSHCSKIYGVVSPSGEILEYEADLKIRLHTFGIPIEIIDPQYREVFRWKEGVLNEQVVTDETARQRAKSEGSTYGFMQWLTIGIRRLLEITLPKKYADRVRGWRILWEKGETCSETLYYIEFNNALFSAISYAGNPEKNIIRRRLNDFTTVMTRYNPHTFTPVDLKNIYLQFNDLIEQVKL